MSVDDIEPAITRLVQQAPMRDAATVAALLAALRAVATPLALVIARIVEYVDDDLVDPGIALPALAEACATLVAGVHGRLDARVLDAAAYQIATLEPMPDRPPKIATPDVAITQLRKRPS
ncbi:MAG: hypothetical protein ABI467_03070 [Kofleriaceae bacterium]